jgi:hypothetical protein
MMPDGVAFATGGGLDQKSGLSAVGAAEYTPGYHCVLSAQTRSTCSSRPRRSVTVAEPWGCESAFVRHRQLDRSPLPL